MDEITVASSLEGAGTDDIPSGQPLIHNDQPAMATHAAEPPSPATNMAANVEARDDTPVSKGKAKKPKMSTMYSPMSAGVNYQIFNPYGGWSPQGQWGQGHHLPMPPHPYAPMAAGPIWATPPPVAMNSHCGTAPTPVPVGGLVPISLSIIFSLGKIYW